MNDGNLLQIYNPFKERRNRDLFPNNLNAKNLGSIFHVVEDIQTLFNIYNQSELTDRKILISRYIVIEWVSLYDLIIQMNQLINNESTYFIEPDLKQIVNERYRKYQKSASLNYEKYRDIRNTISAHRDSNNQLTMSEIKNRIALTNIKELTDSLNCACEYFNTIKDLDIFQWTTLNEEADTKILNIYSPELGFLDS